MRTVIFLILFAVVFTFATVRSDGVRLGFGTHSFTSYGWTQRWLTVDHRTQTLSIHADGRREGGERWIEREIHWRQLAVSASVAAGIAAVLTVPFSFLACQETSERV